MQELIKILHGIRTAEEQNALYVKGVSQKDGYKDKSEHQDDGSGKSSAIDMAPYPVDWSNDRKNMHKWYFVAGFIMGAASVILKGTGFKFRWGGNWDMDQQLFDQKFYDLGHFEVRPDK